MKTNKEKYMKQEQQNKLDTFIVSLPRNRRKLSDEALSELKYIIEKEPELFEDVISYTKVISEGKYSIVEYVNAVRYVTYQMMGYTNRQSYLKIFTDKANIDRDTIDKFVNKYNKSKLVLELQKIATVPLYLTHHHLLNKAVAKQAELLDAKSEMVQHLAAKELCNLLAPPEENHMSIDVNIKKDTTVQDLESTLFKLAEKQVELIGSGKSTNKDIAEMNIIDAVVEEN